MASAKCVGQVVVKSYYKCEGSAVLIFSLIHILIFFQSPSCLRGRSLVPEGNLCQKIVVLFLKHKFVRALLLPTLGLRVHAREFKGKNLDVPAKLEPKLCLVINLINKIPKHSFCRFNYNNFR